MFSDTSATVPRQASLGPPAVEVKYFVACRMYIYYLVIFLVIVLSYYPIGLPPAGCWARIQPPELASVDLNSDT